MQIAETYGEIKSGIAKCGKNFRKARPLSQDVAAAGAFLFAKNGGKKLERPFYFFGNGRKWEDSGEKRRFLVEKKSLLFGRDFRILGSTGGEKWGFEAVKWRTSPCGPIKGGKGAA